MFEYRTYPHKSRFVLIYSGDYKHDSQGAHSGLYDAAAKAKSHTRYFDMLVDMSEFPVAPTDRTDSGAEMIAWCEANGLRHGAFVTQSVTMRMQLKRLSKGSERMNYFNTRLEAERWLDLKAQELG